MKALLLIAYIALVVALFWSLERIEASAPRVEDRRAENAAIALVCAFVMLAMILCAALGIQPA